MNTPSKVLCGAVYVAPVPDSCCFVLENRGALYASMLKAQAISIYVPTGIVDLKLDLIAISP